MTASALNRTPAAAQQWQQSAAALYGSADRTHASQRQSHGGAANASVGSHPFWNLASSSGSNPKNSEVDRSHPMLSRS